MIPHDSQCMDDYIVITTFTETICNLLNFLRVKIRNNTNKEEEQQNKTENKLTSHKGTSLVESCSSDTNITTEKGCQ